MASCDRLAVCALRSASFSLNDNRLNRGIVAARKIALIAGSSLALAACGGGSASQSGTSTPPPPDPIPSPSPAPTPAPAPAPAPAPSPGGDPMGVQLPAIASNFDVNAELVPAWGTGAIPASAVPDNVGAFRFICNASHLAKDDPIVYPGQPGKSHLHQFFGNTAADANSTYASLRTTGNSTCNSPLNRSAYWMPAMMNGQGQVVKPDYVAIYYKRLPKTNPDCFKIATGGCVDLPRGLRFVFGTNMLDMTAVKTGGGYFNCQGTGSTPGHYPDIVTAAKFCPVGAQLGAVISAPECWDGKNLDSADHRSHVAYTYDPHTDGTQICPATHPYLIPTFTMGVWYTTDADLDRSGSWSAASPTWHLASDVMAGMPMMKPGTSFHADWFGAWDDSVMNMWAANCVDKLLNCSGGDLGNGKQLKMFSGFTWNANPRIVNAP